MPIHFAPSLINLTFAEAILKMGENTEARRTSPGAEADGRWVGSAFAGAPCCLSKKQLGLGQHQKLCAGTGGSSAG